ncbi:DUF6215 domain-containing protein [Streptomyces sp. APSN-46.1]|uniref:DUF6215 domain-containing protein n=1 Tax=Streptomyces sp. APSN-46.1 TaxID=2929049 RepID=UPI001FB4F5C5|nr:DUF6215 domain-containing protein [Streptomyces sp. APSN-46.1]MCJ1679561.1 DUF6215 domain-containing protein [Streptomyces sp. APSN-46.1]
MTEGSDTLTAGAAWGQAVTAVALIGALGGGLWVVGEATNSSGGPRPPATCSNGKPTKTPERTGETGEAGNAPRPVSGEQLCTALNRPELAELLGTPTEIALNASGNSSTFNPAGGGGKEIVTPSAKVQFETYTVNLTATADRFSVADSAVLLGNGAPLQTVLGRPAFFSSDRTLSIRFRLDGSDAQSVPGLPTRVLTVAQDEKDSGGSFELTVWRTDGRVPDDAVLLRVAEKVLPAVPDWAVTPN